MSKCVRCGRSGMGVLHQALKLNDGGRICFRCYRELGGDPFRDLGTSHILYSWDDIREGFGALSDRRMADLIRRTNESEAARFSLDTGIYRQLETAAATDPEKRLVSAVCAVLSDEGCDLSSLAVAPGENGSLLVMVDGVVMLQLKSDSGVKWIMLPHESGEKIRISGPARINAMAPRILQAYRAACGE